MEKIEEEKINHREVVLITHDLDFRFKAMKLKEMESLFELEGVRIRLRDPGKTEFIKNGKKKKIADSIFHTQNPSRDLSIECQSGNDLEKAIINQNIYCLMNNYETGNHTIPYMIATDARTVGLLTVRWGEHPSFSASSIILPLYRIDGDKQLKIIRDKIKNNRQLSLKDRVFLIWAAYTRYSMTAFELLKEVIDIAIHHIEDENEKKKLLIYYMNDCKRLVKDKEKQRELWGKITMEYDALDMVIANVERAVTEQKDAVIRQKDEQLTQKDEEIGKIKKENQNHVKEIERLTKEIENMKKEKNNGKTH